jgi:hypothetical protein
MQILRTKGARFSAALFLLAAIAGCSEQADQATVTGTVTLDGQPLAAGEIRFAPADGQSSTAGATISEGKFTASVPPGEKKVQISAPKVTGKKKMYDTPESPTVDIVQELLPARYNVQTELTISVGNGTQEEKFDLKSK